MKRWAIMDPCPKPLEWAKWLIKKSTKEGMIVGSGTIVVAAKMLGRKYIGIDISEKYCEIAERRLKILEKKGGD